jgi:hypothetical protein
MNRCLEFLESIATDRELESRSNNINFSAFIKQQLKQVKKHEHAKHPQRADQRRRE